MATLREVQFALQEKIERLKQWGEIIEELEDVLLTKGKTLNLLKLQDIGLWFNVYLY